MKNTLFLSFALTFAESIGAFDIFLGVNAVDYSNYPYRDTEFIESFEKLANLATAVGVKGQNRIRIHAPLMNLSKAQIIQTGLKLGVDYSLTLSCSAPNQEGHACGMCDACHLRILGFQENHMEDPAPYQNQMTQAETQSNSLLC